MSTHRITEFWTKTPAMKKAEAKYRLLPWYKKAWNDFMRYLTENHGDQMP